MATPAIVPTVSSPVSQAMQAAAKAHYSEDKPNCTVKLCHRWRQMNSPSEMNGINMYSAVKFSKHKTGKNMLSRHLDPKIDR